MEQYTHTQRDIESKSVRRVVDCPPVVGRRAVSLRRVNVLVYVEVYAIFFMYIIPYCLESPLPTVFTCVRVFRVGKVLRG